MKYLTLIFYNFLFPVTLTKKNYFFTRFGKFDKENFIFLLTFANLTKKIYFFARFGEFDERKLFFCSLWRIRRKKICILSLSPFSQKYTVQVLKFFKTGFAALFFVYGAVSVEYTLSAVLYTVRKEEPV